MGFLFFLILSVVVFGIVLILSLLRGVSSLFFGRPASSAYSSQRGNTSGYRESSSHNDYHSSKPKKKVFSKDEGEYVHYEEIKD